MNAHPNCQTLPPDCDVAILGGGPAGAAAAITLARAGRAVAVIEKSRYDQPRLGETLPPAARPPLARLGVWEQFSAAGHAPSPGVLAAWGEAELHQNHFIFNPYGHGWHLDRQRFDALLAEAARQAGAWLYCGAQLNSCLPGEADGWQVEFTSDGCRRQFRARCLIDASGRAAALARQQGAKRINADRLVGLAGLSAARSRAAECDACTLVEACAGGWWYSALLPGARLVAVYMTDADLLPRARHDWPAFRQAQLRQTIHTRNRLRAFEPPAALRVAAANSSRLDRVSGRDWLAVGDAALSFDPLSAQGLLQALASGLRAGEALNRALAGADAALNRYAEEAQIVFEKYTQRYDEYYSREQRWLHSSFWQRRHAAAQARLHENNLLPLLAGEQPVERRSTQ